MTPIATVYCSACNQDVPLRPAVESGDCPQCGEIIDPDAPARLPTDAVVENWDKVFDEDYEPEGGVDYAADEVEEPDRDVESITSTLTEIDKGDRIRARMGVSGDLVEAVYHVLSHERDVVGFDHRLTFILRPRESDSWTRAYLTGVGADGLDPWEVVSAPYDTASGTADLRDYAANGWIVDVEETTEPVTSVDMDSEGGEDRVE